MKKILFILILFLSSYCYGATVQSPGTEDKVNSINGETGVVVLDTSDIDPSTDRNYMTDDQASGDFGSDNLTTTANVSADNGTFSGDVDITGNISADNGTFSGKVSAGGSEATITDNTYDDVFGVSADGIFSWESVDGADDQNFYMDLDGSHPVLYSLSDTTIEFLGMNLKASTIDTGTKYGSSTNYFTIGTSCNPVLTPAQGTFPEISFTGSGAFTAVAGGMQNLLNIRGVTVDPAISLYSSDYTKNTSITMVRSTGVLDIVTSAGATIDGNFNFEDNATIEGKLILSESTPANATADCQAGTITIDDTYIYVCIDDNTWKRAEISTW